MNRATIHSLAALTLSITLAIVPATLLHAQTDNKLVQVMLTSKLDSKSAKVGDPVTAKIENKTESNGLTIPSGSKLIGKVTAASREPASISVEFDSLERKNQPSTTIESTLVAAAPEADSGSAMPIPSGKGGYNTANPVSSGPDSADPLTAPGSTIKNVTLTGGTFASAKDFKFGAGTRLAVTLSPATK